MPASFDAHRRNYLACFTPHSEDCSPTLPFIAEAPPPPKLLFGRDPYLLSGLLSSIGSEAINRRLTVHALYDPYLPHRLTALWVEGVGSFTLSPQRLTVEGGLVDCNFPLPDIGEGNIREIQQLAKARCALAKEITAIGRLISDAKTILATQGACLADRTALREKAERIAKKFPHGESSANKLSIQSYDAQGAITRLPFGSEIRILGLPSQYSLASLFLTELSEALSSRRCRNVLLTAAFTGELLGILLPEMGICYLSDAPEEMREKEVTLSRFLHPFTAEERRRYRRLSEAADALQEHLCRRLGEYRTLADREQELLASLHSESRLQNFRKRLLIDLFCP